MSEVQLPIETDAHDHDEVDHFVIGIVAFVAFLALAVKAKMVLATA